MKAQAFYVFFSGKPELQCLGFDGKLKWPVLPAAAKWGVASGRKVYNGPRRSTTCRS